MCNGILRSCIGHLHILECYLHLFPMGIPILQNSRSTNTNSYSTHNAILYLDELLHFSKSPECIRLGFRMYRYDISYSYQIFVRRPLAIMVQLSQFYQILSLPSSPKIVHNATKVFHSLGQMSMNNCWIHFSHDIDCLVD